MCSEHGSPQAYDFRPERVALAFAAACALHDIGKLDTRFQRKAPGVADALRPATAGVVVRSYDHGAEGFRQIEHDDVSFELASEMLGRDAGPLLRAVCGHHGSLPGRDAPDPSRANLPRAVRAEDQEARQSFLRGVAGFFRSAGADVPWPAAVGGALVQRLAGLCAIADWVGSNADFFPYDPAPIADVDAYWRAACERAEHACGASGLLRARTVSLDFGELFPGYAPRDVQKLTQAVPTGEPALVIVEAEMGKGKTEAALSTAARFLASGQADGITVALPTMATSNAMFGRVRAVAERLFPGQQVHLSLAHGRASQKPEFSALVRHGLRAADRDAPEASVSCARWLVNRKRVLLAQLGVGTIDQALQAALLLRHSSCGCSDCRGTS